MLVSKRMENSETVVVFFFRYAGQRRIKLGKAARDRENNEAAALQVMRKAIQSANKKCG